jgi:serine/threonine protein kinase
MSARSSNGSYHVRDLASPVNAGAGAAAGTNRAAPNDFLSYPSPTKDVDSLQSPSRLSPEILSSYMLDTTVDDILDEPTTYGARADRKRGRDLQNASAAAAGNDTRSRTHQRRRTNVVVASPPSSHQEEERKQSASPLSQFSAAAAPPHLDLANQIFHRLVHSDLSNHAAARGPEWLHHLDSENARLLDIQSDNNRSLGEGGFGTVHRLVGRPGSVLKVTQMIRGEGLPIEMIREINVYSSVRHPNVQSLAGVKLDVQRESTLNERQLPEDPKIGLIMPEAIGGDLHPENGKPSAHLFVNEHVARALMEQMLRGVDALHQKQIVHGDLKPGNFLFNYNKQRPASMSLDKLVTYLNQVDADTADVINRHVLVYVADMGSSRVLDGPMSGVSIGPYMYTKGFIPPEHRLTGQAFDTRSDIWALASTFFDLVSLNPLDFLEPAKLPIETNAEQHPSRSNSNSNSNLVRQPYSPCLSNLCLLVYGPDGKFSRRKALQSRLAQELRERLRGEGSRWKHWSEASREWFVVLLVHMLRWAVDERPTACELLSVYFHKDVRSIGDHNDWHQHTAWVAHQSISTHMHQYRSVDWANCRTAEPSPAETSTFHAVIGMGICFAHTFNLPVRVWILFVLNVQRTLRPFLHSRAAHHHMYDASKERHARARWMLACMRMSCATKGRDYSSEYFTTLWSSCEVSAFGGSDKMPHFPPQEGSAGNDDDDDDDEYDALSNWFRALDDAWFLTSLDGGPQISRFDAWDKCADGAQVQALLLASFRGPYELIGRLALMEQEHQQQQQHPTQAYAQHHHHHPRAAIIRFNPTWFQHRRITCNTRLQQVFPSSSDDEGVWVYISAYIANEDGTDYDVDMTRQVRLEREDEDD